MVANSATIVKLIHLCSQSPLELSVPECAVGAALIVALCVQRKQRWQAQQALRESEALRRAVLRSLEGFVAAIDQDGVIIAVHEAWSRFAPDHHAGPAARVSVWANYLEVCRRAILAGDRSAREALLGIESVLYGQQARFACEYPSIRRSRRGWAWGYRFAGH